MSNNHFYKVALLGSVALLLPNASVAQTVEANDVVTLSDWRNDDLYSNGISVEQMMDDADVYGPGNEEIGSVENVLIGENGRVLSIIAQVGGFWDIGDTHVNVPWDQVEVSAGNRIVVPVTEENADDYSIYADDLVTAAEATGSVQTVDDDLETGPRTWRATDLIGDYARLRDEDTYANYGYIEDIIIRNGEVAAVLVSADVGWGGQRGTYAYPYYGYGYGWSPAASTYDLPYNRDEIGALEPYDRSQMDLYN